MQKKKKSLSIVEREKENITQWLRGWILALDFSGSYPLLPTRRGTLGKILNFKKVFTSGELRE